MENIDKRIATIAADTITRLIHAADDFNEDRKSVINRFGELLAKFNYRNMYYGNMEVNKK